MATKKILNPVWDNEEKTRIRCDFVYEDGNKVSAAVTDTEKGNPDWAEIHDQFKTKDIGKFVPHENPPPREPPKPDPERIQKDLNEKLFATKLDVFKMDEIKKSTNRVMKAKIRKAKNLTEVYVYTAVLVGLETNITPPPKTKKKTKTK